MDWFEIVGLWMGLASALTMWGTALAIRSQFKLQPELQTPGARFAQGLHLFWVSTVAILAYAVVAG